MAPPRLESEDQLVGTVIADRYRLRRRIGKGGMGAVYEGEHIQLGRRVAIKILAPSLTGESEAFIRFRREAELLAGFQHPNIVGVLDLETLPNGSPCIVMEHLTGEDLAARIARGPLPWRDVARIADEVLSALSVAHKAGVVHRDLKPQNIFLAVDDEGRESVKLLDFGVSKISDAPMMVTTGARVIGTPAYMSPEQADAKQDEIGAGTDLWAMGCVLFEMASGVPAFNAPTYSSLIYRICHGDPEPLPEHRADAPPGFIAAVEHCLTGAVQDRVSSADALREELRLSLQSLAPGAFREVSLSPRPSAFEDTALAASGFSDTQLPVAVTTLSSSATEIPLVPPKVAKRPLAAVWISLACAAIVAAVVARFIVGADAEVVAVNPETAPMPAAKASFPVAAMEHESVASAAPALVQLVIESKPTGANVFDENNRYLGVTPMTLDVISTSDGAKFVLRKDGYRDKQVSLAATESDTHSVRLAKKTEKPLAEPEPVIPDEADEQPKPKKLRGPYEEDL